MARIFFAAKFVSPKLSFLPPALNPNYFDLPSLLKNIDLSRYSRHWRILWLRWLWRRWYGTEELFALEYPHGRSKTSNHWWGVERCKKTYCNKQKHCLGWEQSQTDSLPSGSYAQIGLCLVYAFEGVMVIYGNGSLSIYKTDDFFS